MQDWVRNDLVGDWAVPRHLVRSMVPFVPVFAAFFLFPGPLGLRASMVLLGVLLAVFYAVSYMAQNRSRRLERHGLPPDLENPRKASRHDAEKAATRSSTDLPAPGASNGAAATNSAEDSRSTVPENGHIVRTIR